jgi:hypothetical protein
LVQENLKLRYWLGVSAFIGVGLLLLVISQIIPNNFFKNLAEDVASALFISGAFGLISELILKDKMVSLILEKLNLKEQIDKTGVVSFHKNIDGIDFKYYFKSANKNIDIVHVYGRTWTTTHFNQLKDKLRNSNCKIRVILVHPESKFISGLAYIYNCSEEELKGRILEVEGIWKSLYQEKQKMKRKKNQSSLELYYTNCFPAHSLYRFDDDLIQVQSKPTIGRSNDLTTIVCKRTDKADNLFNKYVSEIEEVLQDSKEVNLEEERIPQAN